MEAADHRKIKFGKTILQAFKIALGSSFAIYFAHLLNLRFAISAGSIALLTIVTTKWGTVKLSFARVVTFFISAVICAVVFHCFTSEWIAYGLFVFLAVMICEALNWRAAISVNALIGMHFLSEMDFSKEFIWNEFQLVLIGISISVILNLFYAYDWERKFIVQNMRYTENRLQIILGEVAAYLSDRPMERNVWKDITELEEEIQRFVWDAKEYQDNTFHSHPGYYIEYFEMRLAQCHVIHNLHQELRKIRKMPVQAKVVANYILYMMDYVIEINIPVKQMERLEEIFDEMRREELPATREEFESRSMLYHILMDLEEFLICKKRFVQNLDETKLKNYWNVDKKAGEADVL